MGVSGSAPATPGAPRNRHLTHLCDPRSPSVGIPRTPIEVLSSAAGSPQPGPVELAASSSEERDPRSPTPGIFRTPIRAVSSDSVVQLVKQLGERFGVEAAAQESPQPLTRATQEPAAEEPPERSSTEAAALREDGERPPSPSEATARPTRVASPALFPEGIYNWDSSLVVAHRLFFLLSLGNKPIRRKTNNKVMATSGGTGRSPLSILQDDNSPSTPASRQGKRHVLVENLGEKKEVTVDLSRSLKSGNCAWNDLNKENQHCPFVEN
ncbi:CDCA3 protein, partial [Rhinopomastus cyanomelas]|nr:CDCA3 protein [Rhinopomastus cyanomelas]